METHCPLCGNKLQIRTAGLVCKNWKCKMYWKLDVGPVYQGPNFGWQIRIWQSYEIPSYENRDR